ncbi:MAG: DNA polymerase III subunit delta [Leptolinea sp.]|jgi:DNA polymerase-3 subunit delta|nr:DNA polymerase III subunit delta [Leptolinea sp.]
MTAANIFVLHGDDPAGINERLKALCASLGDPGMTDLNLARLDGRTCTENDIRSAALAIPFLADHRVVILNNPPITKMATDSQRKRFTSLLDEIPPTTHFVLVVEDETGWKRDPDGHWQKSWKTLNSTHWLMSWVKESSGKVSEEGFHLPDQKEMPAWISAEALKQGGQFTPQASSALAEFTGSDTQIARLEIGKLLSYVDYSRPVTDDDVTLVSISQNQANVFQFNEAVASGQKSRGLHLLHQLLETEDPIMIFGSLVAHFRRLILIKEALQQGGKMDAVARSYNMSGKRADAIFSQCRRFSPEEFKKTYLRLADLDFEIKNGITPADLALELFLMELKSSKT